MKLILKAIFICAILCVIGCKKQDNSISTEKANFSENEKQLISNYLGSKKSKTGEPGKTVIDTILLQINWDQYYITDDGAENKVTVFALKNSLVNNIFLLLFSGKNDGIYSGAQLAVVNNKDINVFSKLEVLAKLYTNKEVFFTGSIEYFRITKEFLYKQGYKNGIKEYTAIREYKKKSSDIENATEEETCYNVYLITYWSDGSTTYDFLYSYCVPPRCPDLRAGGSLVISTGNIENTIECSGTGGTGSGPGGTSPNNCQNFPPIDEMLNNSFSVSEGNGSVIGIPFIRPNTGVEERTITQNNWRFYRGTTPLGNFHCISTDKAVQRKLNNGNWYFVSVQHVIHGVSGTTFSSEVKITDFVATGIIESYTSARQKLNYNIQMQVFCGGSPIGTINRPGQVSEIGF